MNPISIKYAKITHVEKRKKTSFQPDIGNLGGTKPCHVFLHFRQYIYFPHV